MIFEKQLGELLFAHIKKLLNQPIKSTMFLAVGASWILTFLASSNTPHNIFLQEKKEYFAGWKLFVTTWDSLILNGLSLICLALIAIKIINLFQSRRSELFDFRLYRWIEVYIEISILYSGIVILVEPNFASFFTHLDSKYYGATETCSIVTGLCFTWLYLVYLVIMRLQDAGLLPKFDR